MMPRYEFTLSHDKNTVTVHLGEHGKHTAPVGQVRVVESLATFNGEGHGSSTMAATVTLGGRTFAIVQRGTVQQISDLRIWLYALEMIGAVLVGRANNFALSPISASPQQIWQKGGSQ